MPPYHKKNTVNKVKRFFLLILLFCLLLTFFYITVRYYHIHYHTICWFNRCNAPENLTSPPSQTNTLSSPTFHLKFDIHNKIVSNVDSNLSGLTYDFDNRQLIGVINSPPSIVILDTEGNTLRHHVIHGANDTEGITYVGNGQIALLQEKRHSILLISIPTENHAPIFVDEVNAFKLDIPEDKNNGPEGIAYHAATDTFYIVKERQPTGLYTVQGLLTDPQNVVQNNLNHYLVPLDFATDFSGIALSPDSQHLILLSDEAQMLITMDLHGNFINHFDLAPWNLSLPPPQPEGVAIGPDNTIYIVSEPNLFYRLRPQLLPSSTK